MQPSVLVTTITGWFNRPKEGLGFINDWHTGGHDPSATEAKVPSRGDSRKINAAPLFSSPPWKVLTPENSRKHRRGTDENKRGGVLEKLSSVHGNGGNCGHKNRAKTMEEDMGEKMKGER